MTDPGLVTVGTVHLLLTSHLRDLAETTCFSLVMGSRSPMLQKLQDCDTPGVGADVCFLLLSPVPLLMMARGVFCVSPFYFLVESGMHRLCTLFHDLPEADIGSLSLAFSSLNQCFVSFCNHL